MRRSSSITIKNSMRSFKRVFNIVLLLVTVVIAVSCVTDVDYTMGEEFIPSNQNMELRRRVYALGECVDGDMRSDCSLATTRQYRNDSLRSDNRLQGYFGYEQSDIYGDRKAGFMSQMIFSLSLPEERGWGYRPIYDSTVLLLYITDFHGDTTKKHRFNIYEITSNDYLNLPEDKDTTFYINFDPKPYIGSEPIFTFEFPDQDNGIYVKSGSNGTSVRLEETEATAEYVSRLMLVTDEDGNPIHEDSLALDHNQIYVDGNEDKFVEQIKGVYIAPAEEMEGAMFATDLENTALLLYSRDRYEQDPTIIRDTTYMVYNFYLDADQYDLSAGNVSINSISHDYEGSDIEPEAEELDLCYVEGLGGVAMEVEFTDEFIQSLADIVTQAGKTATVSVNQAVISIYMENSLYDYTELDIATLTPMMNDAMARMGMYIDYVSRTPIADYQYSVESSSIQLSYDGYLNRSLACYKMNISNYIQALMLTAANNVDEAGKVNLELFATGESEGEYVQRRRFYVAPEASSMYTMKRQPLYGMGGNAPIKLELTYTIVN